MKRVLVALSTTICFVVLYAIGAYLGDLVGIGGYDGLVSEELYMAYQIGDVEPWLYRATELGALACLGIGAAGAVLSLVAAGAFIGVGIVRSARRGS